MSVVTLRLERVAAADLDRHLVGLGSFRLVRSDDGLSLEIAADMIPTAFALLGRAGLRVASSAPAAASTAGLVAALARDLEPIAATGIVDVVRVRALGDGEATARLARRALGRRRRDGEAMRAILDGSDRAFAWTRAIFATRRVIRTLRGVRPVVFDRHAVERAEERIALVGGAALSRWAA